MKAEADARACEEADEEQLATRSTSPSNGAYRAAACSWRSGSATLRTWRNIELSSRESRGSGGRGEAKEGGR
jgi:hypothetical protein